MIGTAGSHAARAGAVSAALLGGLLMTSRPASACSVCQCGTTTLTASQAPNASVPNEGRWIVEVEGRTQRFEMGDLRTTGVRLRDQRIETGVSAGLGAGLRLGLSVPWVQREAEWANGEIHRSQGVGDVSAQLAWNGTPSARGLWGHAWAGVRAPTGPTVRHADGRELDHDAQPGSGAWIPMMGAGLGWIRDPLLVRLDAAVAVPTTSRFDFRPSNALLVTASTGWLITDWFVPSVRVDGRWESARTLDDGPDPNSGGTIVFASPELLFAWREEFFAVAAVRFPVADTLRGQQEESWIASLRLVWRSRAPEVAPPLSPWGPMADANARGGT